MKRRELLSYLDDLYKPQLFDDNGLNGLQVEGGEEIERIAVAVSASEYAIESAARQGAGALIVHHGLFWKRDPVAIKGAMRNRIAPLLRNNISLIAYHLPMDAHPEIGNNWKAAYDLGWRELSPFGRYNRSEIGVTGTIEPIALEPLCKVLEGYFRHPLTLAPFGKREIRTIGFVSGGAYKWVEEAVERGLDLFLTGSFDEPAYSLAKEGSIHFAAAGHFATERTGPRALQEKLVRDLKIDCLFIDEENPF